MRRWQQQDVIPPARVWSGTSCVVRRRFFACRLPALLAAALVAGMAAAAAQEVTAPALKAAFIYNFAKFTDWPADVMPANSPFVMCVAGDAAVAEALERMIKGRDYAGHPIVATRVVPTTQLRTCHILYLAPGAPGRVEVTLRDVIAHPVLTISDIEGFTKLGGVTQLYYDGGQLRLFIDTDAAARARLKMSARLLQLSTRP